MKATIILILAIITSGLMAGIFFTWSNAVTPGIGKLHTMEYLRALQSMNRVILNPTFRVVFIGAVIMTALAPIVMYKAYPSTIILLLVLVFIIYWIGVFGVTFLGNIPLNRLLDTTNLDTISIENATALRTTIEAKWNYLNHIRTCTSITTFIGLIIALVLINK